MSVSSEVLQFLATQFQQNVRELEGALNRVVTYAKLSGAKLDLQVAAEAVQDLVDNDNQQEPMATPKRIMDAVANYYGVTLEALTGTRRDKKTAFPRQVAMYLLREHNHCALAEIGRMLGGRDHTTILHGYEKIAAEVTINSQLSKSIEQIRQQLSTKRPSA
jgi:chromosomal replication initiator protein